MEKDTIKDKQEQIAQLQKEIKEMEREEDEALLEHYRKTYVGRCFSGSMCGAIKIIDINLASKENWFQAHYVDVTVPAKYFETEKIYQPGSEPKYRLIKQDAEIDIEQEPWIEVKCDTLGTQGDDGLNYGHEITQENFDMRVAFALKYISDVSKMTSEECLEHFNKENYAL